ncbi:hypothetical protein [Alkalimarinus coralli]|uniref:hypothetical protein n=1 Tax=Alkalimarinus coralli TaxID=2935863 RepID=UPI00202B8CA3|nr:hypothetical protein [Alkalimarinus coralli]
MGSKSKSSQSTVNKQNYFNNIDYGNGGGGSGFAKNVNMSESSMGDISIVSTDHGAMQAAAAVSAHAVNANGAIADSAINLADSLGTEVIDAAGNLAVESFDLSRDFGGYLERSAGQVIDLVQNEADENREFAMHSTAEVGKAYQAANSSILALSRDHSSNLDAAYSQANQAISDISERSISEYAYLAESTNDQINQANIQAQSMSGKAMDYVFQSTKDATERNTDTMVKWGMGGAVAVVGFMALAMMRAA